MKKDIILKILISSIFLTSPALASMGDAELLYRLKSLASKSNDGSQDTNDRKNNDNIYQRLLASAPRGLNLHGTNITSQANAVIAGNLIEKALKALTSRRE